MKDKKEIIKNILQQLKHIVDGHLRLQEQTLKLKDNICLSPKEIRTIQAIGKNKEMNIKELGEYFNTSKSAASQIVSKLVKKGFVRKKNPANNNKELNLYLTNRGKEAFVIQHNIHDLHISNLTQNLDLTFQVNELETASGVINLLRQAMDKNIEILTKS